MKQGHQAQVHVEEHGQEVGQPETAQPQGMVDRVGPGLTAVAGHGGGPVQGLRQAKGTPPEWGWRVSHVIILGGSGGDDQAVGQLIIAMPPIRNGHGP